MPTIQELAQAFLDQETFAVVGVRRTVDDAANGIYRRMRELGMTVYAINPHAEEVEGDPCYPNLSSTPRTPQAVMIVTRPEISLDVVKECAELGIEYVWMHKSIGNSVSEEAVEFCHQNAIHVIPGACPMMYMEPVDIFHKCMRGVMATFGRIPRNTAQVP